MNQNLQENYTSPRSVASMIALLWRKVFGPRPPKPQAPCEYCGEMTDNENSFCRGLFVHEFCINEAWEERKAKESERKKIEIIKTAIRELEAEKEVACIKAPNEKGQRPGQ